MNLKQLTTLTLAATVTTAGMAADNPPAWPGAWQVFGPVPAAVTAVPDERTLATLPAELELAGTKYPARTVDARDGLLDFAQLFAQSPAERVGAWMFGKITAAEDIAFEAGAGADWWMEWYVNGKPVFDTLKTGNRNGNLDAWNHRFTVALKKGDNVIACRVLSGSNGFRMVSGAPQAVRRENASELAVIEGVFGKAEFDLTSPRMTALWLRQPDGSLTAKSLLAADSGGCTYLVGWTAPADVRGDRRFDSSASRAHRVRVTRGADNTVSKVVLEGILPAHDAPAVEDWEIAPSPDGAELVWKVTRTWRRPFQVRVSGTPALFLGPFGGEGGYDPKRPAVTSTLWYEPTRILGETHPRWLEGMMRCPTAQTLADRDTWAVYKLFSNFPCQSDLRLAVNGGYLYRRGGNTAAFNEVGSVAAPSLAYRGGTRETVTLTLKPVDKRATGYQLNVELPDKAMQAALRDFYGSVFNGGMICDQKTYDFGNESEGYKYIGGMLAYPPRGETKLRG
jgi:hypothetical protein